MPTCALSDAQIDALFADGFEPWMTSDLEVKRYIGTVRSAFADLELVVLDEGEPVAAGWGVPLTWTGAPEDLPGGYTDALRRSVETLESDVVCDTFAIMAIQVHPNHRGRGVASKLIRALRSLADEHGWDQVIAPVRPTRKSAYPTIGIDRYMHWQRDDGLPLDPWLRTHVRAGAEIVAPATQSQMFTADIDDWSSWCSMRFPESGSYVIPGGLALVDIDIDAGIGVYVEPNVWVTYPGQPTDSLRGAS